MKNHLGNTAITVTYDCIQRDKLIQLCIARSHNVVVQYIVQKNASKKTDASTE
jgi:hypothetical protein